MKTLHTIFTNFAKRNLSSLRLLLVMLLTITTNVWGAEDDTYDFPQNISVSLNNCATFDDIELPEQDYPIKEVIITYAYNKSASPKAIVTIDNEEIGTKSFTGTGNLTTYNTLIFSLDSPLKGSVIISNISASGCTGTGKGTLKITNVTLVEGAPAAPCTVTLMDDNTTLTQSSAGESVDLPSRDGCDGYTFAGWTKSWNDPQTSWTTTAPTIIPAGSYTPTANESLYPVYTKTEGGTPVPATLTASYTSNSGWTATNCGGSSYWVLKNGASITSPVISDLSTVTSITFKVRTYGGDSYKTVNVSTSGGTSIGSASASSTTLTLKTINVSPKLSGSGSIVFSSNTTNTSYGPGINEITINYSTGGSTTYYISVPDCCTQLAEVTNLKFSSITSNSITVAVPDDYSDKANASGYTFNCYSALTGGSLVATDDENGTSHTFTGLTKNTTYYFTVIAKGEGDYCNSVETSARESSKTLTQYTITLNPNGGTGDFSGWSNYTMTVDAGTEITLPELSKTGYDFDGWHDGTEMVTSPYTPTTDITLTAQWTAQQYNIIYKDQGDKDFSGNHTTGYPTKHTYGTATTLKDATKIGYTFEGWYTDDACTNTNKVTTLGATDYTGAITLYAKWTEKALTRYRTDCDACILLDGYAEIHGTYHFFPGETITLTVTPPANDVPYTYQWQKKVNSDYENIEGETGLTYTKENATTSDVGHYRCVVSSEGYCDLTPKFDVKCLQLYVYYNNKSDVFNTPLNRGAEENTATISVDLQNANYKYYFKITDGCGNWYGFDGDIHSGWCTDVPMNVNEYCGLQTTKFGTYVFNVNYSDLAHLTVSVIYPAALQETGKEIYLDNNVLNWTHSNNADGTNKIYYRIGRGDHNNKTAMTLVPGTANLYKVTTSKYDNFDVWHIANNGCWSENNSIFKTKTGDEWAATQATAFETLPVTLAAVTVTPTDLRSVGGDNDNNNCEFYNYNITEGMKTWNAEVIEPINGTITVEYTHHDGTEVNDFTSGTRDLAHTCLLTITATADEGYSLASLTVNDVPFISGNTHTLTEDAVIKAEFTINTHTVTWKPAGGNWDGDASDIVQEYEYGAVIEAPDKPTFECYEFVEWTPTYNAEMTMPDEDLVFTATWNKLSYTITFKNYDGTVLQTSTVECGETPSYTGATPTREQTAQYTYTFSGWSPDIASATQDQVYTAQFDEVTRSYTVTWMVGTTEYTAGTPTNQVEYDKKVTNLPTSPQDDAIGTCANKFMGWSTKSSGSNAENADYYDDLFTTAENSPAITDATTFYAVFATEEETTGGTVEATLSFANTTQRTSFSTTQQVWEQNGITFTHDKASGEDIKDNYAPIRCYKNSKITITHTSNEITKIVFDCNSNEYATALKNSIGSISGTVSSSSDKVTVSFTNAVTSFAVTLSSGQVRMDALTVTAGGGTITTYSNYVTNCCATPVPTNGSYTSPSGTSVTLTWDGESTRYHITGNGLDDYTYDESYTVTGLTECNEYTFYVSAYPAEGCESAAIQISAQPFSGAKTVNYDYNGGSGSPESFTTSCENQKIILPNATRLGYTFNGWFDAASGGNLVGVAGAEYNPATSPITLYAHWTETIYQLTHSGSNYTNTENKTSIKSSETPFTLHYTCTGDYGLPATISITGGGKSWTVNTDYTWEVAADKQSATLVIKETVISADVTITINVATRYTVTFVHNDKGVFSGSETIEVLSSENTITLPTVTDVSCGFYDTFEGWIEANEDYTESTSKPAGTIYTGGANYTVNGDCTLRALYSKCEGDATQVYRKVTTTGDVTDGTYILVANTATPRVYSGYGGATYGSSVEGLTADGEDFSTTLPVDAKPITVTTGTGTNAGTFAMYNADRSKYLTYTGSSNTLDESDSKVFIWKLTDGSNVNTRSCPAGVLTPNGFDTRVLQCNTSSSNRFACYTNNASYPHVFLYKLIDKCTRYYSTNPSCEKPVGVHIVYNANAVDASMSCSTQNRTYKVEDEVNKYPQLASQLQFCTNATREGYTLVGWNTQANGQGTTYNINQNYYNLPVSGELDGEKWITLNLYAMWKPCIKFNLGNATGGTGVPDAVLENGGCVLPTPTAEQLGTIPCGYEFYAWSETSVNATQTKPALFMPGDTYTGSALTLYAVYRLCEVGSNPDLFSLSYTISDTKYYVGPVTRNQEGYAVKFTAITDANNATVFGMKSIEGKTYKSLYWMNEETKEYMYWKDNGASFTFTSEEDDSYGWTISGTTTLTFLSTPYMTNGSRYLSADASEIGCPSEPKAVTQFTKEMASTTICTYATEPECSTTATLQFVTNGGTLNYPTTYDANSYQNLTPGSIVYLPTATFAGEWTFEGWMKDAPLESQNLKPETVNFIEVELDITTYSASKTGTTTFYAVYSKTNDDKQFDPVNGGTYKLFAIGADGTKTYMPIWSGGRGTLSGVTTCAETGDYTITPGTGTHAGQYQITCGEYTLGVVGDISQTDLNEVEGTWWNINPNTSGKGTWRITVVGSSERALSCSFSTAKSFGNYAISNLNDPSQTVYRDMEIGECIYTEYTSTPENIPYITITGAPVKITSTNGERVYAPTTLHIEAHNFTGERIIHLSATNGFGVDPVQVRTNGQGAYSGDVKVYYEPTADGDGQTINSSVLTASQTGGTNAEKISQTFAAIQGRNMPANFVIAAKWDGHWYALPANCTSSLSSTEGLLIEVNDVENPTMATSAPASAKYGLREVIPSRQTDYGQGIVFTERFAEGDKQFALYNGSNANIQVNAQYTNYAQTNPDKYEWIPSTSDFKDYTLTNASTGRNLGLTSGTFGAYTAASNQVRLLPATFYEPAPVQVLKWKENSVIVMYTGAEATATTQVGDNALPAEQTLAGQKLTHGIYELTTDQALTTNAGGTLSLYFGANTRVELEIPLIISGEVTASANAHDVVILENSKLTAAATKYSYKDVYVYGGAKLAIPDGTELGVNNIILRAGGVATNGAGQEATYQYIYPQVELKGTLTSSVQNIRYEYVTDYDHWYHLVLPFDGSLTSIHYPTEYYGDQVKLDNTGSWQIKRYDGATRATGNYDAWKDIEKDEPKATIVTAGKGYIFWGAPKKITANDEYDRPTWGIQRITMLSDVSETISKAKDAENADKTISGLGSYKNVTNNSGADNDQGWNLIGNPYMVNLTGLNSQSLQIGQLIHETDASGNWTGKWQWDNTSEQTGLRYVTIPSDHFETYEAKPMTWFTEDNPMIAGRSFFVQIAGDATDLVFDVTKKASLMPALLAENNDKPVDIETGIVLSNETLQDEVNFWIKDGKTNDYEYNADYPKTPNNNQFNIYGVHTNGDLSWVATGPEYAAESMPIGYQVPAAGTYILSLSEIYNSDGLDALYVTDHEMSPEVTVDIMSEPYEFSVNQAETNNERFTVSVRVKAKTENGATGLGNVGADGEQIHKFIYQDKMYILHHGVIYDATGKRVITINK